MMSATRTAVWLTLAGMILAMGTAFARHEGGYLHQVTTKLQTPHYEWARPYAPGKPRVLFVVPRTMAPREIVELWQRFDLDFEAFTIAHSGLMSFESDAGAAPYDLAVQGTSIEEKTDEILAKLQQPYDAFVMANASFDILPREAQYKILKQVSDGAGLVFAFGRSTRLPLFKKPLAEDRALITQGVALAQTSIFSRDEVRKALRVQQSSELPDKIVETYAFGKGRLAVLNYGVGSGTYYGGQGLTPAEPYSFTWAADYDQLLSLVYKTILWSSAARRPQVSFGKLPEQGVAVARGSLPLAVDVELTSRKAEGMSGKLTAIIRDRSNIEESRVEQPLKLAPGAQAIKLQLPRLKTGGHFLNLFCTTAKGVEAWASLYFEVTDPLTFTSFGTASEFAERGAQPAAQAVLTAPAPANAAVLITLTDTNDRVYLSRRVPAPVGQTTVSLGKLDLSGATAIASRLHGELRVGNETVAAGDQMLFVPHRQHDEFRSIIWGIGGDSGLTWIGMRQLRAAGFTDHLAHPSPEGKTERLMALGDMPLVCYAYRVMGHGDEQGWRKDDWVKDVADGCFYNPELHEKARDLVIDRIKAVIPYGPSLYSLGDENYYDYQSGFSPTALVAFRKMLQGKYGDVAALNRAWGTNYASWDEVQPTDVDEGLKQGLWPQVHDHMSFNEQEYADYHHYLRDEIRKADPGAWVGAEGSEPGDLEKTIAGMEIWGPYSDKRGNELLRSLAPTQLVRGNWWGGYVGSHGARAGADILWRQLISGAVNTSLYFAATGSEGLFAADMSYAGYFEKMLPDLREIYGGIGQLIAASTVPDDGLAIHWSQASEHSTKMFSAVGSPAASQGNLLGLLDRIGFGYRFVTTGMIEGGGLGKGNLRALFLPCSQAISNAEAAQIKAFVAGGGLLIADVGPGSMDGNCKPLWKAGPQWQGQLDDLLGITRNGEPKTKPVTSNLSLRLGSSTLPLNDFAVRADQSVVGQGVATVENTPVFLGGASGKGKVVFLNFPFPNPEHPDAVNFLRALLAELGLKPMAALTDSRGYLMRRFRNGALQLVGVVRETETAQAPALKLARPAYVYDTRSGKLLGKTDTIALLTTGPKNRVFAILPQAAGAPTIQAPAAAQRGMAITLKINFAAAGGDPAGRILRLQALRPDGAEAMAYRSYLTMQGEQAATMLPWAWNDPAGRWTLRVTDVATGQSAAAKVTVR